MRIQGNSPYQEATAAQRLEGSDPRRAARAGQGPRPAGDRVELSSEGAFATSALKAAGASPEIRQDVVERARQKLAAGGVGQDAERLADALIDHMLGR
ncbi:MAG: flagellar biosynthesis anti-sigma factor FlgM [Acidobacteriota bacterium]